MYTEYSNDSVRCRPKKSRAYVCYGEISLVSQWELSV